MAERSANSSQIEALIQKYGDLVFDLCETMLSSSVQAQHAFRSVIRGLKRRVALGRSYSRHERAWVLHVVAEELTTRAHRIGRKMNASEQASFDAGLSVSAKLKQFHAYLHRLGPEDQLLLLLRDKYGIPYPEISAAMATPEGSLKLRRQQALRTLEDWLWDGA